MIKHLILSVIRFYQQYVSLTLRVLLGLPGSCRYGITCSEYAEEVIEEFGIVKGGGKAVVRVLSCQPYRR